MAKPILDLPGEFWKPVVGWEGLYEVSNVGRVKSLARTVAARTRWGGTAQRSVPERVLNTCCNTRRGSYQVSLYQYGKRHTELVHRLVLEALVGPCPEGMEGCHNDGDPANNRLENLRWDTRKNNHADKRRHGTLLRGSQIPTSKLTESDIPVIRRRCAAGESQYIVAADYNVSQPVVSDIVSRKGWAHV